MFETRTAAALSTFRPLSLLLTTATLLISSGCTVFGIDSVEEAPFQLVQKENRFEIRDYESFIVAETRVNADFKDAGSEAFRKLFGYISGENEVNEKISMTAPVIAESKNSSSDTIAMTAPVTARIDGDAWLYSFVLPRSYSLDNAPRPLNPDVSLAEATPKRVAILRYSGRATAMTQTMHADALLDWIGAQGMVPQSKPRWAGYNPPWTLPPFRRNEVLIDVAR